MMHRCWKLWLLISMGWLHITAQACSATTLVIFGDSLSDNGNYYRYSKHRIPAAHSYYQGRYSDGPIWVDELTQLVSAQSKCPARVLDYAFGGATVLKNQSDHFTLRQEMDSYVLSHPKISPRDTMIIWIGANDYLAEPEAKDKLVKAVFRQYQCDLKRLIQRGARRIILMSLPDLGLTPMAHHLDWTSNLSWLSSRHNQRLQQMLQSMQKRYPSVTWTYIDIEPLLRDMIRQPHRYGLNNTQESCIQDTPKHSSRLDCHRYLFIDKIHPTTRAHHFIARTVFRHL